MENIGPKKVVGYLAKLLEKSLRMGFEHFSQHKTDI